MSKKNSSVNLRNYFKDSKDLLNIFQIFKTNLDKLNKKKILVAVSGGPDSLALVALTIAYRFHRYTKFHYLLVDHNIRKKSNEEAKKIKILLKKKKINLKLFVNKKKILKNIQAEARKVRYEILLDYCKKNKINTILTAHNLEDQVETFFIRLSRGSGLKGLSAMERSRKVKNVNLYRPLLEVQKKFLIKISRETFGTYLKDPSNKDLKFLRTKIRNLKKTLEDSGIKYKQIFRSIQNLSDSKNTLDKYLKQKFKELIVKRNREIIINYIEYNKLENDIKMALINAAIKKLKNNYYDLRSKKVENLIKNFKKKNFKRATLGGCIFHRKGENLCLMVEKT